MRKSYLGRFFVNQEFFIGAHKGEGENLFKGFIPVHTERHFDTNKIEYVGYHKDFEPFNEGERAPEYDAVFNEGEIYPKWVKVA